MNQVGSPLLEANLNGLEGVLGLGDLEFWGFGFRGFGFFFPNAQQKGSRFKGWGPGVQWLTSDRC